MLITGNWNEKLAPMEFMLKEEEWTWILLQTGKEAVD
jgi:hypothetical protein